MHCTISQDNDDDGDDDSQKLPPGKTVAIVTGERRACCLLECLKSDTSQQNEYPTPSQPMSTDADALRQKFFPPALLYSYLDDPMPGGRQTHDAALVGL